jgi:DNA-3-methyladenine glycosylase II
MNTLSPLEYLSSRDARLAEIITVVGNYSIEKRDPFESLIRSIIYQQLSGKAAGAIYKRFLKYYGDKLPTPQQIIVVPNEIFRNEIGLSFKKILYIKDLSKRIVDRQLNFDELFQKSDSEIIAELVKVNGIGRWTAEMFLIFGLGREDVMPVTDLGIRRAIMNLYNLSSLPTAVNILEISSNWKPYRSIASWYLWKSLQL